MVEVRIWRFSIRFVKTHLSRLRKRFFLSFVTGFLRDALNRVGALPAQIVSSDRFPFMCRAI